MIDAAHATALVRRLLIVAGLLCGTGGCSTLRNVEQWKCDHWGMCHFGVQPTASAPQPVSMPYATDPAVPLDPTDPAGCPAAF